MNCKQFLILLIVFKKSNEIVLFAMKLALFKSNFFYVIREKKGVFDYCSLAVTINQGKRDFLFTFSIVSWSKNGHSRCDEQFFDI